MKKRTEGGATPNALLGLLSMRPMSGYDIRQTIGRSIGYFWSESYGQIYPGLKRLAAAGLAEKKTERQKGRPDRTVYSLTAAGRRQLREWLKQPPTPTVPRNELLLKLFFGVESKIDTSREHVLDFLKSQQEALKTYAALARKVKHDSANDPKLPFYLIAISHGRFRCEAMVKWCKDTLKRLDDIERGA